MAEVGVEGCDLETGSKETKAGVLRNPRGVRDDPLWTLLHWTLGRQPQADSPFPTIIRAQY